MILSPIVCYFSVQQIGFTTETNFSTTFTMSQNVVFSFPLFCRSVMNSDRSTCFIVFMIIFQP